MSLREKYKDKHPIGVIPLSNWGGIVFFIPDEEDRPYCDYVTAFDFANGLKSCRRSTVRFSDSGRPYINKGKSRYYLDEAMRTE